MPANALRDNENQCFLDTTPAVLPYGYDLPEARAGAATLRGVSSEVRELVRLHLAEVLVLQRKSSRGSIAKRLQDQDLKRLKNTAARLRSPIVYELMQRFLVDCETMVLSSRPAARPSTEPGRSDEAQRLLDERFSTVFYPRQAHRNIRDALAREGYSQKHADGMARRAVAAAGLDVKYVGEAPERWLFGGRRRSGGRDKDGILLEGIRTVLEDTKGVAFDERNLERAIVTLFEEAGRAVSARQRSEVRRVLQKRSDPRSTEHSVAVACTAVLSKRPRNTLRKF